MEIKIIIKNKNKKHWENDSSGFQRKNNLIVN